MDPDLNLLLILGRLNLGFSILLTAWLLAVHFWPKTPEPPPPPPIDFDWKHEGF